MWNKTEGNGQKKIVNDMVQHMNNKYANDTFEYKSSFGGGAGADTKTIVVSSNKYPSEEIYVRYSLLNGGTYTDNYLGVQYAKQTELTVRDVLDSVIQQDYLLIYEVDRFACPNLTGTLTFEEYIASENACIGFTVVVGGGVLDKTSFETTIETGITNAGLCCSATIYFDNGLGAFDMLNADGLSKYTFNKLYGDVFTFDMKSNKEFSSSYWGD